MKWGFGCLPLKQRSRFPRERTVRFSDVNTSGVSALKRMVVCD